MDLIYRFDPYQPIKIDRPTTAAAAIQALVDGNQRLVDLIGQMQHATLNTGSTREPVIVPVDLLSMGLPFMAGVTPDQAPFALVLGCSDARAPIESIFDQSFNALFVVRIAGNVLGTECLGSFDYAVRHLKESLKAVVVLGHTCCGAVTAAVDTYLNPNEYAKIAFSHPLRSLLERVLTAVRCAAHALDKQCGHEVHRNPGYRAALIEASVYLNAAITAYDLQGEIVNAGGSKSLEVFYGACDIATMHVQSDPAGKTNGQPPSLQAAPKSTDQLAGLANHLTKVIAAGELLK